MLENPPDKCWIAACRRLEQALRVRSERRKSPYGRAPTVTEWLCSRGFERQAGCKTARPGRAQIRMTARLWWWSWWWWPPRWPCGRSLHPCSGELGALRSLGCNSSRVHRLARAGFTHSAARFDCSRTCEDAPASTPRSRTGLPVCASSAHMAVLRIGQHRGVSRIVARARLGFSRRLAASAYKAAEEGAGRGTPWRFAIPLVRGRPIVGRTRSRTQPLAWSKRAPVLGWTGRSEHAPRLGSGLRTPVTPPGRGPQWHGLFRVGRGRVRTASTPPGHSGRDQRPRDAAGSVHAAHRDLDPGLGPMRLG